MFALGNRLQKVGNERVTLIGRHTANGTTVPAQLTWEVPGKLRYDRNGPSSSSLVYDNVAGLINASAVSVVDVDLLESLVTDAQESFLYGFLSGQPHRFLGARFRADDGKTPNYQGPWSDIYEAMVRIDFAPGAPVRPKLYYFDSKSKLLTKTVYILQRGTSKVTVSTEYSGWSTKNGQTTPGQIVRKENGAAVFTFDVTTAAVGPTVHDGLFPSH
jgi:hypothetical protein